MAPYFYKLAQAYKDIQFVEVPVTDKNANLHQGLGVPSFAHFLQMGQKKTPQLSQTLHGKSAQLADTRMGKVTLKGSSFTL